MSDTTRFHTNYNYVALPDEFNDLPSDTVPDQSLSVQEIMRRHVQGRPLPKSRPMHYSGDQMLPPFHQMDNMEQVDALKNLQQNLADKQNELETLKQKRAERRKELKAQKAAEAAKNSSTDETPTSTDNTPQK